MHQSPEGCGERKQELNPSAVTASARTIRRDRDSVAEGRHAAAKSCAFEVLHPAQVAGVDSQSPIFFFFF